MRKEKGVPFYMRKEIILGLVLFSLLFSNNAMAIDEEELKFGYFNDKVMVSINTFVFNEALASRVNEIGNKVLDASNGHKDVKWTFRVINDPIINAYSAAGGFVYIKTGVLDILESEDEVAAVLAHEIAHINESHQMKWVYAKHRAQVALQTTSIVLMVGGAAAGAAAGAAVAAASSAAAASTSATIASNLASMGAQTVVQQVGGAAANAIIFTSLKGYGKSRELEADALAVKYLRKANYDPNALVSVFKKLIAIREKLEVKENYGSSLINAEPGLEERTRNAEELILKAK